MKKTLFKFALMLKRSQNYFQIIILLIHLCIYSIYK